MACHPEPSHPFHAKAPVNAQLGLAGYVADALSQLINNCFTFMDTKDQIILTFFIADEINYWIQTLGIIFPVNSCRFSNHFQCDCSKDRMILRVVHFSLSVLHDVRGSTQHRVSQSQMQMEGKSKQTLQVNNNNNDNNVLKT